MITVAEARTLLMQQVPPAVGKLVTLERAFGLVTLADIASPHDHPLFDCSAVDGYAIRFEDRTVPLRVQRELAAGDHADTVLPDHGAVRIFTGAAVPEGADTVVMQEYCAVVDGLLRVNDPGLRSGANIRRQGEQLRKGDGLLEKGTRLGAAAVGLMASVGITEVWAAQAPRVAIVRTGGEFTDPRSAPLPGMIFSSNELMLQAALHCSRLGDDVPVWKPKDDSAALTTSLEQALAIADVVICTGGVSAGDHDLVRPVLEGMDADIIFHKVAQKPGKPMLFARKGTRYIFGLPGNPRAVMVLFWEYVLPFLHAMQGLKDPGPLSERALLTHHLLVKGDRAEFRAAHVTDGQVTLLRDEGSHMLRSVIEANALAYIPAEMRERNAGELIEIHRIPQ